ncbi:hypothetical protein LCGC14_0481950 [marine sediment metagenome]|uniref:Histidine kinase/HSP90-like ATPase domain-containing protein n=1 Tax=marine sediment metagenome TaxID=412755 RepID=A0A0F9SS83_9ZZZZ|nr:MAG: Chaperone protein [Candidatus Lokiarchaeum sp. GC14_75]
MAETFEFQAEIKKLLKILSKSLYQHPEVFLRELISNSVDALKKIHFILLTNRDIENPDVELKIEVWIDSEAKTLIIKDTGVGMVKDDLINDLGTIAGSGTEKFAAQLEQLKEEGKEKLDLDIIGQFGVGFYSVFMVANNVSVLTKSYKKEEPALHWESEGSGNFSIKEDKRDMRGTDVNLHMNEEGVEFLNRYRIEEIIKKYSNFVSFPIYVRDLKEERDAEKLAKEKKEEDEKKKADEKKTEEIDEEKEEKEEIPKPVNETTPLWKKSKNEISEDDYKSFYQFISKRYDEYQEVINYRVDGQVQFKSIMFIPKTPDDNLFQQDTEYGLSLYSNNVMIMERCKELLPQWMRFVRGVVESDEIPLNVARETIQTNRKIRKMSDLLIKRFLRELKGNAELHPDKYKKFWTEYGNFIKEGLIQDRIREKRLKELLRFKTSKTKDDEIMGFKEYVERMKEEQEDIYYLAGENIDRMKLSPHLGYYLENDLEVILFDATLDNFLMMNIQNYTVTEGEGEDQKVKIYKLTPIDISEKTEEKKDEKDKKKEKKKEKLPKETKKFLEHVKEIVGDKIVDAKVSKVLHNYPCRLATPAEGPSSSMQRAMRYWTHIRGTDTFEIPRKIFELNPDHPLIRDLIKLNTDDPTSKKLEPVVLQLFENSLVSEGDLPEPASMVPRINQILEMFITGKDDVERIEPKTKGITDDDKIEEKPEKEKNDALEEEREKGKVDAVKGEREKEKDDATEEEPIKQQKRTPERNADGKIIVDVDLDDD